MKTLEQTAQGFVKGFERFADEMGADLKIDGMDFVDQMRAVLADSKWSRKERNQIIDLAFKEMLGKGYFIIGEGA